MFPHTSFRRTQPPVGLSLVLGGSLVAFSEPGGTLSDRGLQATIVSVIGWLELS